MHACHPQKHGGLKFPPSQTTGTFSKHNVLRNKTNVYAKQKECITFSPNAFNHFQHHHSVNN